MWADFVTLGGSLAVCGPVCDGAYAQHAMTGYSVDVWEIWPDLNSHVWE